MSTTANQRRGALERSTLMCLASAFFLLAVATPAFSQITLSEIRIDQPSTDNDEYFELAGAPGAALDGLTYVVIGDGSGGSGVIEAAVDLTAQAIPPSGFFVAAEGTFTLGAADLFTNLNFENSDNVTHLLVRDFSGASGDDLDTDDDGTLDATPWSELVDCVALVETVGSGEQIYCATTLGPDGTFVPAHAFRCPAGWEIGVFDPSGGTDTPGAANPCTGGVTVELSEIRIDQPSSDNDEYFELAGTPGGALDGFTYLVIGDGTGGSGVVEAVVDLTAQTIPVSGFFVAAEGTFTLGAADFFTDLSFENSDNVTHLLVRDFSGASGDDLDTDDDGVLDLAPWSELVDCVALVESVGSGDQIYCPQTAGPDGSFVPAHVFRCPAGFEIGAFDPASGSDTPGAENLCVQPRLVINEIDYDQPSTDFAEFIEIKNVGEDAVDLAAFALTLVNGSNGSVYRTIDLPSTSLAPGAYFVVCGDADEVVGCDLDVSPDSNLVQNGGPDAVALTLDGAVIDTVSYEGDTAAPYTEGSGAGLADSSSASFLGISRFPDGGDTDVNNVDLSPRCITPGAENVAEASGCPEPLRPPRLVVNEIDYDQPSTDVAEFIEIVNAGDTPADLAGVSLELVNGNGGAVYATISLPATSLEPGAYFVVCGDAANVANCDLDVSPSSNLVQNGSPDAVALTFGGEILDVVSYEGAVAAPYSEGAGAPGDSGASGEDFKGISRRPDGADTDDNAADFIVACITPGAPNTTLAAGCGPLAPLREIFEIQGAGTASPFEGATVLVPSSVVTALAPNGFFLQTPAERTDGDPDTSDGLFIFTGSTPGVAVGDLADVLGTVEEFFGFTELAASQVTVLGAGTLPSAVLFDAAVPSPDPAFPSCAIEYECYEGMLVEVPFGTVVGPNQRFGSDPIAEVFIVAKDGRSFREKGIEFPGLVGLPVWDGNPEVFELDPDRLGLTNQILPTGSTFSARGVIGFDFGDYELFPTELTILDEAELPTPVRAKLPGEVTIGSLNLFRLFDDVDDGGGEQVVSTAEYARRLGKFSAYVRDVLGTPDLLGVQEVEKLVVLEDLAAQIAADDPSVTYQAFLVEGNDVGGIDVGFLARASIAVDAVTQLGADEILTFDGSLLHDRPPLLLEGSFTCPTGGEFPLAVMVNHLRSLSGIEDAGSGPRVRQKRLEQAQSIAEKVQGFQTASPEVPLVLVGDYNAFEFTDGYVDVIGQIVGDIDPSENLLSGVDLVEPDLVREVLSVPADERYSFIFRGSSQILDHALTSAAAAPFVRGLEFGRGNADAAVDLINDDQTVLRASDHDGLVLYLMSDCDGDGVLFDEDICLGTEIPEGVPTVRLGVNRFALVDGDGIFDTTMPGGGHRPPFSQIFTIEETGGCSCEQIIEAVGVGRGHEKFGCSLGLMRGWIDAVATAEP